MEGVNERDQELKLERGVGRQSRGDDPIALCPLLPPPLIGTPRKTPEVWCVGIEIGQRGGSINWTRTKYGRVGSDCTLGANGPVNKAGNTPI